MRQVGAGDNAIAGRHLLHRRPDRIHHRLNLRILSRVLPLRVYVVEGPDQDGYNFEAAIFSIKILQADGLKLDRVLTAMGNLVVEVVDIQFRRQAAHEIAIRLRAPQRSVIVFFGQRETVVHRIVTGAKNNESVSRGMDSQSAIGMSVGRSAAVKINVRRDQAPYTITTRRSPDGSGTLRMIEEGVDLASQAFRALFVCTPRVYGRTFGGISKVPHQFFVIVSKCWAVEITVLVELQD